MIEILIVAVIGTAIAGLWDLFTTEVPDQIPFALVGIGILYWVYDAISTGIYTSLIISATIGTLLLALGLLMYKKGQWGGADAWVLAAIGYMVPVYNGRLFMMDYITNFAIVALLYTLVYALVIGALNPRLFGLFRKDLLKMAKFVIIPLAALAGSVAAYFITGVTQTVLLINLLAFASFLAVFFIYAKTVEKNYFTRKIHVSKLKKGDVLDKGNWIGLTDAEISRMKTKNMQVTIKDGVRFVPVFAIALVVTLLFGSVLMSIF